MTETVAVKVDELKPCPFCGGKDGVPFIRPADGWRYVQCISCLATSGARPDMSSALRAWNQRAAGITVKGDS